MIKQPNIVFIFADEWRAQATGYNGDPNCETPVLDSLAAHSIDVTHAVAGSPVCCPYRASLMTGQYPLTHGVFINDVELNPDCHSVARAFGAGGYRTAYIGKWHLYGSPDGKYGRRTAFVPRNYQLGFDEWLGFECNHDYNDSLYFHNDDPTPRRWEGYDAFAQSHAAADYIKQAAGQDKPFMLMLSWGPPHFPLHTAPEPYRQRYTDREIILRPNVPAACRDQSIKGLRGYYAHIAAIDDALAIVTDALDAAGIADDTILIVTADHGDMRGCQGWSNKQCPWDESIRVPFLLRWPALHGRQGRKLPLPVDAPDLMPTLLGLSGLPVPATVEGRDWSAFLRGECAPDGEEEALLVMPVSFTELLSSGIKPYRGLRTLRYTYVRSTDGPWLLYDNVADPYQLRNRVDDSSLNAVKSDLDRRLNQRLEALGDKFRDGHEYLERAGLTHYNEVNMEQEMDLTRGFEA